ncbi:methyltransferase domain-containing protein [Photorhabdus khanii]|uniref:Methyltransferase domain-containing protein n=1 Tax=Photorhabdus khanii TaxID=1004150 RepID=A0A7C9GQG6_9GAMM|nr:class I SAM-dependent methyltransferase [Photorhabdus khanii]MQL48555.1 methyltransferase domain-containing protein [Photorhabdus khanii]
MFNSDKLKKSPGFIRTFSRIAPTYEKKYGDKLGLAHDECLEVLKQHTWSVSPQCILDIGCGTGALLERLHQLWPQARCIGVDPAEGMVDEAVRRRPFASFLRGNAEALPLESANINLVVCSMSFGHWYDKSAGLKEVKRILHPEGLFCLVENSPPGWGLTYIINRLLRSLADYVPKEEVIRLAESAGLHNVYAYTTDRNFIVSTFQVSH